MEATHLDFDSIMKNLSKSDRLVAFMTGILLVDYRRRDSQEYIFSLLDEFDRDSGNYIDFYLPGYVKESDRRLFEGEWDERYSFVLRNERYYFQPNLFEKECINYRRIMGVDYDHFPILILLDVIREEAQDDERMEIISKTKVYHNPNPHYVVNGSPLIIELEKFMRGDNTEVERLFIKIFEYAEKNTSMGSKRFRFRYRVLLGNHIPRIRQFLIDNIPNILFSIIFR